MPHKLLLPNKFKLIGWFLFIPSAIFGLILTLTEMGDFSVKTKVFAIFYEPIMESTEFFKVIDTNITPTLVGVIFIIGAMLVSFSKEKKEDEYIAKLRLSSLLWAVWFNYILLFLCFLFIYGGSFFNVMIYNMFTVLIIFIVRFNYILYKNSKSASNEK